MIASSVLWLMLAGGQVVTIPGFASNENCQQVGAWYRDEATRGGKQVQYRCGPGPDTAPGYASAPSPPPRLIDRYPFPGYRGYR